MISHHAFRRLVLVVFLIASPVCAADFEGTWDTTFGRMALRQRGDEVDGAYVSGGDVATLHGKVENDRLTFTYRESKLTGEGWFQLAADDDAFWGEWRESTSAAWSGWKGQRTWEPAELNYDGLWATTFGRMRLAASGDKVVGCYAYGNGSTIEGVVEDEQLAFDYTEPAGKGRGHFESAAGGHLLCGKWRTSDTAAWSDWYAVRLPTRSDRTWLVVIEAPWEKSLEDQEYSFGGMLKAFFARSPNIRVRHRWFDNEASFRKWCAEVALLAEPVVLVVASHGSPQGVTVGATTLGADTIAAALRPAANLKLLHFSSCQTMDGNLAQDIRTRFDGAGRFPISGYRTSVDWAASAVAEFMYFDLILSRGIEPQKAAEQLQRLMPFSAAAPLPDVPFKPLGLRIDTDS